MHIARPPYMSGAVPPLGAFLVHTQKKQILSNTLSQHFSRLHRIDSITSVTHVPPQSGPELRLGRHKTRWKRQILVSPVGGWGESIPCVRSRPHSVVIIDLPLFVVLSPTPPPPPPVSLDSLFLHAIVVHRSPAHSPSLQLHSCPVCSVTTP